MSNHLNLKAVLPIKALNAGYLVTRGVGRHVDRTIDSFEIIYVNSGTLGIYEENVQYNVGPGQALILFPDRRHGGTRQFDKNLAFYWLHFTIDQKAVEFGNEILSIPQLITLAKPEQYVELLRRFIRRQNYSYEDRTILNLILMEMLCELSDSVYPIEISNQKVVLADSANQYIKLHLNEVLSTSLIAEALDCNTDYLGRTYNQIFGKTLTDAIHEYRMNRACKLLIETNLNVNEIANECGYTDVDYFRRIFKKYRRQTAREYRQTYCLVTTTIAE